MQKKISLNEKIFVCGANGMAGSAIVRNLIASGYGDKKFDGKILCPSRKELDLTNYESVKQWFQLNKPSVVIIAAAKVGGILANFTYPYDFIIENLKIQNNVIELSYQFGVKRLLFLGSSCIYPRNCEQPIKEEFLLSGSLESTNQFYAIAKISGIKLCEALRIQKGFDAISLMPTNLYGPGDNYHSENSHVIASLIKKFCEAKILKSERVICWGTGTPLREFLHVDDLGNAVVFALENFDPTENKSAKGSSGKVMNFLNVGTGYEISIRKLAETISEIIQYQGDIIWDKEKPDGTPRKLLDSSELKKLGWRPSINLQKGLQVTIKNYQFDNNLNSNN